MSRLSPEFLACASRQKRRHALRLRAWGRQDVGGQGADHREQDPGDPVCGRQCSASAWLGRLCFPGGSPCPLELSPTEAKVGGEKAWPVALVVCLKWRCEGGPEVGCTQASRDQPGHQTAQHMVKAEHG